MFTVTDTGIGISENALTTIFDHFSQVAHEQRFRHVGTGLGLSIAKSLAELLGGDIDVYSQLGAGSRFVFTFSFRPSRPDDIPQHDATHAPRLTPQQSTFPLAILIADDDEHNRMVARDTLLHYFQNARIVCTDNGTATINAIRNNRFDVALLDVQMPQPDGYECAQIIRAMNDETISSLPLFAFTASLLDTELDRACKAGMTGWIPKPFTDHQLIQPLADVINNLDVRPPAQPAHDHTPLTSEGLFMKLVPGRLEKLRHAVAQQNLVEVQEVIHLMRPQLLSSGWSRDAALLESFEYLDPNATLNTTWVPQAMLIIEKLTADLKRRSEQQQV